MFCSGSNLLILRQKPQGKNYTHTDLVTFTEEILNGKHAFLCSEASEFQQVSFFGNHMYINIDNIEGNLCRKM